MYYYKKGSTYIASETAMNAEAITKEEYDRIKAIIENRPVAPKGFAYRLTADLEWELYELPAVEDPELTEAEALDIILGGAT